MKRSRASVATLTHRPSSRHVALTALSQLMPHLNFSRVDRLSRRLPPSERARLRLCSRRLQSARRETRQRKKWQWRKSPVAEHVLEVVFWIYDERRTQGQWHFYQSECLRCELNELDVGRMTSSHFGSVSYLLQGLCCVELNGLKNKHMCAESWSFISLSLWLCFFMLMASLMSDGRDLKDLEVFL